MERIKKDTGDATYMAISPKGYENIAIGIGEMRRYIRQQQSLLDYYEKSIKGPEESVDSK